MSTIWTDEELSDLELEWDEFSTRHSRSYEAYAKKKRVASRNPSISFEDRKEVGDLDLYLNKMIDLTEERLKLSNAQIETTIKIDSDTPIGIAFTGDWHIGQLGTDYRSLISDNNLIARTPGLYVIGMGDYYHNAKAGTRPGNALYDAVIPSPQEQELVAFRELEKFKGKILGLTRGCHLDWDKTIGGKDSLSQVCSDLETVNLWHGGVLHLQVGDEKYHLGVRHKYGGESKLNTTNAQRTLYDLYPEDNHLDVIALGHLHYCDLQKRSRRGMKTVYLRSGSYYVWDEYGQKLGGYKGERGVPIVILYPNEHRVLPFEGTDFQEAVRILGFYRDDNL